MLTEICADNNTCCKFLDIGNLVKQNGWPYCDGQTYFGYAHHFLKLFDLGGSSPAKIKRYHGHLGFQIWQGYFQI